jgi:class 3 adenylate cyclase
MSVKIMVTLARRLLPNYDVHQRSGYPKSVPIPNQEAAVQIVNDMVEAELFLSFVALLVDIERKGFIGRKYSVSGLGELIRGVEEMGYSLDRETGAFVEDQGQRTTRNWGVIREGEYHVFTFLSIDVAGNSDMVRDYSEDQMGRIYQDIRYFVDDCVLARNGRVWSWEGDGGIAAFYRDDSVGAAVHSAIEILHELLLYNAIASDLRTPVRLRITCHTGQCEYRGDFRKMDSQVIKRLREVDGQYAAPDSVTITSAAYSALDPLIAGMFRSPDSSKDVYRYAVGVA